MAEQMSAFQLREEFNTQAVQSREARNLIRKAVYDDAVQVVSSSVFDPSYERTAGRVRRVLVARSQSTQFSAEQQGYYAEAVLLLDLLGGVA